MDLPFGISWLCTLLLWGCISFTLYKGYNIAHGYSVNENLQTSNQFHFGESLNTKHEDETQATMHQSFVSPQRESVHHENREDISSVTSLGEEMVEHKPYSKQEQDEFSVVSSAPSVQKYEHVGSGYQHPFGLLVKEHTPEKAVEGISFPTITDLRHFIEMMKISFLIPGSDLSGHFQTARETMENGLTSGAENINRESSTSSDSVKEGSTHGDNSKNEVWSEPMNTEFEQSEPDTIYQKPSESLPFPDPVDSTESLISPTVYDNQDSGPSSVLNPRHNSATERVSSNYGGLASGGISGENPDISTRALDVQTEDVQSTSYKLPEQIPSGSFLSSHVTASPVNIPNSPIDLSYYKTKTSSIKPLTSEKNSLKPKYSSHSGDSLIGYKKTFGGFELGKDFQREKPRGVTQADDLSPQKPPSLNSYGKSLYVSAPRGQLYIPDNLPKHRERPAQLVQAYQPTVGKESKDINYTPTIHLLVSTGSVSSNSDLSSESSNGQVGVETSGPHDPQGVFSKKQLTRTQPVFTVTPSSSLQDSSRHDGYLGNQRVSVSGSSILTAPAKDEEKTDLFKQNLASAIQEPKQMNARIPISSGLYSTQSGSPSQVSDVYASFNSPINLALTSEPKKAFSRLFGNEVMSQNSEIKNIISDRFPPGDRHGARNVPTKVQNHSANVNKEPFNMAYWPPKPLSASKVSGSTLSGVFWKNGGNTKRHPPQTGPKTSLPFVNAYVMKSRNGYVRGKVSLSKTRYTPYQPVEGKTVKDQWEPAHEEQWGSINTER